MREIKFRAWEIFNKTMYNAYFCSNGFYIEENSDPSQRCYIPQKNVMQFTGLKDKNDKEIYEGDIIKLILKHQSIENGFSIETEISQVEFSPAYFRLRGSILGAGCLVSENMEIIGNIYENPELLN